MTESPFPPSDDQPVATSPAQAQPVHHFLVQAPVAAMDVDGFKVTAIGLVAFALATVVTALMYPALQREGNAWWLGVSISGLGLGLIGLAYCIYRRRRRRAGHWDRD